MGGGQTVRVGSGCLFVCLFVWFTWDGPVSEEMPIVLYSGNKCFSYKRPGYEARISQDWQPNVSCGAC